MNIRIFYSKMLYNFSFYATVFHIALLRVSAIATNCTSNEKVIKFGRKESSPTVSLLENLTEAIPTERSASDVFFSYLNADNFPSDLRQSNNVGEVTVSNILRHTRIFMTDGTSTAVVRQLFTNVREVLTSEIGVKNIRDLIRSVGFVLRDDDGSAFVQSVCKVARAFAADQESSGKTLRSVITSTMNVLAHKNAQSALEGLAEGLKIYFQQLTSDSVDRGIERLETNLKNN